MHTDHYLIDKAGHNVRAVPSCDRLCLGSLKLGQASVVRGDRHDICSFVILSFEARINRCSVRHSPQTDPTMRNLRIKMSRKSPKRPKFGGEGPVETFKIGIW